MIHSKDADRYAAHLNMSISDHMLHPIWLAAPFSSTNKKGEDERAPCSIFFFNDPRA